MERVADGACRMEPASVSPHVERALPPLCATPACTFEARTAPLCTACAHTLHTRPAPGGLGRACDAPCAHVRAVRAVCESCESSD